MNFLEEAILECQKHNDDYHHVTNQSQIQKWQRLVEQIRELQALRKKATPGKLNVREAREDPEIFYVNAATYEGHPYHGVASGMEVIGDEDYPTKRADAELIVALWNALDSLEAS